MSKALTVMPEQRAVMTQPDELSIDQMVAQVQKIQQVMDRVMQKDEHYGIIPGTKKPTLLKPGAEKLCLAFRLDPQYESTETYDGLHLTVKSHCTLYHITTGIRLGSGEGSCSTKESKYAYRRAGRTCPACGKEDTIIRGKAEYGGGWICFAKKDGCGGKFKDGDPSIEAQITGRVPNEDVADAYNTVLKMANKRSLIAAVLNVTAASDCFTQDLEEMDGKDKAPVEPKPIDLAQRKEITDFAAAHQIPKDKILLVLSLLADGATQTKDVMDAHFPAVMAGLARLAKQSGPTDEPPAVTDIDAAVVETSVEQRETAEAQLAPGVWLEGLKKETWTAKNQKAAVMLQFETLLSSGINLSDLQAVIEEIGPKVEKLTPEQTTELIGRLKPMVERTRQQEMFVE